jgi:hypothetical protein
MPANPIRNHLNRREFLQGKNSFGPLVTGTAFWPGLSGCALGRFAPRPGQKAVPVSAGIVNIA